MSQTNKDIFIQSVGYMHSHIDEVMGMENVASMCGISVSTLKRAFQEVAGQSPASFLRRLRMEYAFRTLRSKKQGVLEAALDVGFEDHSAFSRRFKEIFGYPPSEARKKLNIVSELESITLDEPDFVEMEAIQMQSVTTRGLYFDCAPRAWDELKGRLDTSELNDDFSGVFIGIGHDNPHDGDVEENRVRFTAGICLAERDLGIEKTTIGAGRYARFKYFGKLMNLGLAYHYIYGKWAQTGEAQLHHDVPAFLMCERFPDGVRDEKVSIYVPISFGATLSA